MSHTYYQQLWKLAQNDLKKALVVDEKLKKKGPFKNVNSAKWLIGHLFMNYVGIVNKLDDCYDQMIHPQKRELISRLLDTSLGRLLELKSEIVRIEYDDYCFFDDILIELKLTHQDMEIQVPKYFWRDREASVTHRRELIRHVMEEAERERFRAEYLKNFPEEEQDEAWETYLAQEEQKRLEKAKYEEQQKKLLGMKTETQVSSEQNKKRVKGDDGSDDKKVMVEAIALVQRHERARQGRIRAAMIRRKRKQKNFEDGSVKLSSDTGNKQAKVIQRHWRRYRKRKVNAKKKQKIMEILGMIEPSFNNGSKLKKRDELVSLRRKMQERNQKEYEEALVAVKKKVTTLYMIQMEEDIVDEIRGWFQWFFDKTNFLPDYPPEKPVIPTGEIIGVPKKLGPTFLAKAFGQDKKKEEKVTQGAGLGIALAGISAIGGSALVVADHWIGPQEFLICQKELERRKKAGNAKVEKMSKEEKLALKQKKKEQEKKKLLAEEALGYRLRDSNYIAPLNKADRDYRVTWMDLDESKNYEQRYINEFVKDDKCWELSMEVRKVVDEMMALELEILKEALERDKHPKKRKKKKKKKRVKKKKKLKKDPTSNRTLDDLFMELFRNGIIREYKEAKLKDFLGEKSFGAFDMRQREVDWPPSLGDVRELLLQLCILPLGSSRIHHLSPLIKSVCLIGTESSGKEFLARIICTETAAVMFDLSTGNVAGKYPGKDGLKMLQHLVEKMSRALQPSVIFVDGAEKHFYKKVPKEERNSEPKRLARVIRKIVKGIKPPDQVLLLGISSQPWMAKRSSFLKTYHKIILLPQIDYGSYVRLWQDLLTPYHAVPRNFDVSCLAKVSTGFSVKAIMDTVQNVFTIQRIGRSTTDPFKQTEFLEELLKTKLTDEKTKEKCLKFYSKTENAKKRAKKLRELQQENEKVKKKV